MEQWCTKKKGKNTSIHLSDATNRSFKLDTIVWNREENNRNSIPKSIISTRLRPHLNYTLSHAHIQTCTVYKRVNKITMQSTV